jgi:isopenicillin N synthase-like dioxygenase
MSPKNGIEGNRWVSRNDAPERGWERLTMEITSHDHSHLIMKVHISCQVRGEKWYLARDKSSRLVVSSDKPTIAWTIVLAEVPCINVLDLNLRENMIWKEFDARSCYDPSNRKRGFVLKVLRALREVGAFYISGHDLKSDLFHMCQTAYGSRPYKDDASYGTDETFKTNDELWKRLKAEGNVCASDSTLRSLEPVVSKDHAKMVIEEYFDNAEELSNGVLHAMAAAQAFGQGIPNVCYRGAWRDRYLYCGLRLLSYHPGPQFRSTGEDIKTTARHTDATWLTLLWNDDVRGLHIRSRDTNIDMEVMPPLQGALLINTGNVMTKASQEFYRGVCHWVTRTEETETRTRISMPFFYDRLSDKAEADLSYYNGGTGGC